MLIVDDEPALRDLLDRLLTRERFNVWTAAGIDGALNALQATTFAAVVLDLHLPDDRGRNRSGIEVLSFMQVHDHLKHTPVIILTGGTLTDADEKALWGLHAYVVNKSDGWHTILQYLKYLTSNSPLHPKPH